MQAYGFKRFILMTALLLAAPFAAAQFQPGMTLEQAEAQVKARQASGATAEQIAQEAAAAKVDAGVMTIAMINSGINAATVVQAMINSGATVQAVVNAAIAAGATPDSVTQGATAANVSLAAIQTALASSSSGPTGATGSTGATSSGTSGAGAGGSGGGGANTNSSTLNGTASPS